MKPKMMHQQLSQRISSLFAGFILVVFLFLGFRSFIPVAYAGDNCCGDGRSCSTNQQWVDGYYACQNHQCPSCGGGGGGGGGSRNGVPFGPSSGCCDNTGQCQQWYGSVSTCSNSNGACASGVQCKGGSGGGGTCTQTCGANDCHNWICNHQIECNGGCALQNPNHCGNGICEINANPPENSTNCPNDCLTTTTGNTLGQTCSPGKIYCQKDYSNFLSVSGCKTSTNPMWGVSCGQDGKFHSGFGCDGYDACASGALENTSCAGKTRLSCGESKNGGFVGCLGAKNCFCGTGSPSSQPGGLGTQLACNPNPGHVYTAADGVVHCFDDVGNDSCGAHGTTPASTTGPNTCYRCHAGADFCESYTSSTACTTNCDACKPPGTTPSTLPFVCLSVSKDIATPTFGQSVRFTCGTVSGATKYEFKYKVGTTVGDIQPLNAGSNLTQPFAITHTGSYKVQCRPCTGTECAPWAENW